MLGSDAEEELFESVEAGKGVDMASKNMSISKMPDLSTDFAV